MKPKPEPIADNPGARSDVSAALQPQADPWWLVLFRSLAWQAAWATEADRGRAALLAAVSHDLRAPLAATKAAVTGLRSRDVRLTDDDREELLATAEESLDLLARLAASLLDVSRPQAGSLAIFPRPADLGEIVADVLDDLGPQPRAVLADIPSGLEEVLADPAITERVIANLVGNALRYSPAVSPPLVTARTVGDRVELRVVDHGPGIPEADRERVFLPFHRLGDPGSRAGVGLGLMVARGLTEAMGGTVEPEETPGGGLTMVISLPAGRGLRNDARSSWGYCLAGTGRGHSRPSVHCGPTLDQAVSHAARRGLFRNITVSRRAASNASATRARAITPASTSPERTEEPVPSHRAPVPDGPLS